MRTQQRMSAAVMVAASTFVLAGTGTLLANGQAFFIPASRGPVDLVYFARVKDARTGKPIQKQPYVTLVDPFSGIYIPFQGDGPGHFRSPDIGAAIKEVTTQPIDTQKLEIMVSAAGYETVKVTNIPRRGKGTVELDVRMEPKAGGAGPDVAPATMVANAADATSGGNSAPTDPSTPTFVLLGACFGLAAISAAARTVSRPASRAR